MNIPSRDDIYRSNQYFWWFYFYETIDMIWIIIKWGIIGLFLYLWFCNLGISSHAYWSDNGTIAHIDLTFPYKK